MPHIPANAAADPPTLTLYSLFHQYQSGLYDPLIKIGQPSITPFMKIRTVCHRDPPTTGQVSIVVVVEAAVFFTWPESGTVEGQECDPLQCCQIHGNFPILGK